MFSNNTFIGQLRILLGNEFNRLKRSRHHSESWLRDSYVSTEDPILLTGAGRSGTTLTSVMLNAHSHIFCGPEFTLLMKDHFSLRRIADTLGYEYDELATLAAEATNHGHFLEQFIRLAKERHAVPRYATKSHLYIFDPHSIFRTFPNAQLIYLCRDGRDVAASMRRHVDQIALRHDATCDEDGLLSMKYCAENWRTFANAYRSVERDSRAHLIRYEDLVLEPDGTLRKLCRFLGIPFEDSMLDFHEVGVHERGDIESPHLSGLKEPLYTDSVYRWKNVMAAEQVRTFEKYAARELEHLGYEVKGEC